MATNISRPWWDYDDPIHGRLDLRRLIVTGVSLYVLVLLTTGKVGCRVDHAPDYIPPALEYRIGD